MTWRPIETAPTDGRKVWVKRMYKGQLVTEGWAVFGICHLKAPQRFVERDPLNRLAEADYAREAVLAREQADAPKWLKPDRMYSFPAPTHWLPGKEDQ